MENNTNDNEQVVVKKKKSKLPIIIAGSVVLIFGIIIVTIMTAKSSSNGTYNKQLALAQHYLEIMDYEQAIAAFEQAIAINPKAVDAYLGLSDIYVAMGEDSYSVISELTQEQMEDIIGYYQKALQVLEDGLNNLEGDDEAGRAALLEKIDEIKLRLKELGQEDIDIAIDSENGDEDEYPSLADVNEINELAKNIFHGGPVLQHIARSQREEYVTPLVEKLTKYIAWLETVRDNPEYSELFVTRDVNLMNMGKYYLNSEGVKFYFDYAFCNALLFYTYLEMDDLDNAFLVKQRMAKEYGEDCVHLQEYEADALSPNEEIHHRVYDVYEREIYGRQKDGNNDWEETIQYNEYNQRIHDETIYYNNGERWTNDYEYDSQGRVVFQIQICYFEDGDYVEHHMTYTYPEQGKCISESYVVGDENIGTKLTYYFSEYGEVISSELE